MARPEAIGAGSSFAMLAEALRGPLAAHGVTASDGDVLEAFARHEAELEAGPYRPYRQVLGGVLTAILAHFGETPTRDEVATFGGSVADWPALSLT